MKGTNWVVKISIEDAATKVDDASAAVVEPISTVLPSILISDSLSILVCDVSIVALSFF